MMEWVVGLSFLGASLSCAYLAWVADYLDWLRFGAYGIFGCLAVLLLVRLMFSSYKKLLHAMLLVIAVPVLGFMLVLLKQPVWGGYGFLIGAAKNSLRASHWQTMSERLMHLRTFLGIDLKERLHLLCGYQAPCMMHVGQHTVHFSGYIETKHEFSEIFLRGDYAIAYDAERPVIIDCGAHIGLATMFFKLRYPKAQITAFEPDPKNFIILKRNIESAFDDVVLENKALFDQEGELNFASDRQSMSKLTGDTVPEHTIKVQTVRLSSYINVPVDIVKMDIEGAETPVLQELTDTGKMQLIKNIVMEFHYTKDDLNGLGDVLNELSERDFNIEIRENMRLGAMFELKLYSIPMTLLIHAYKK